MFGAQTRQPRLGRRGADERWRGEVQNEVLGEESREGEANGRVFISFVLLTRRGDLMSRRAVDRGNRAGHVHRRVNLERIVPRGEAPRTSKVQCYLT